QHNKTNLLSFMGVKNMKKEDKDKVINALSEFVVRVANGKATSETEVAVLPEVAKILLVFDS
ncbi:MAG: hypothetical protein VZS12_08780, partial [Ruminococcus bromii]|nr:hypothetical protein [Ruminococcus bromii]